MNKIRVCHIITKLELGGAQQNTLYTVGLLSLGSFEPILISGAGGILSPAAEKRPGVHVYFLKSLIREIRPLKDILAFFNVYAILRKERPLVVHTHSSKAGILGRWAAWCAGVPFIVHTFHGFAFHDFQNPLVRTFYVFLERVTARITDRLIAVANTDIQKGIERSIGTRQKYLLIRSGIDVSFYKNLSVDCKAVRSSLGISPDAKVVITISPFKRQKNLHDLIDVARKVTRELPGTIFVVVGDGSERASIEQHIALVGLEASIKLLGWQGSVGKFLLASDLFLLTSLWEGLPRSILEAMCCGLPVVANAVDGTSEIVKEGDTGYLIKPHDIDGAAHAILKLLRDPTLSKRMGLNGKESIGLEFDINYMVTQQEDLYNGLAGIPGNNNKANTH